MQQTTSPQYPGTRTRLPLGSAHTARGRTRQALTRHHRTRSLSGSPASGDSAQRDASRSRGSTTSPSSGGAHHRHRSLSPPRHRRSGGHGHATEHDPGVLHAAAAAAAAAAAELGFFPTPDAAAAAGFHTSAAAAAASGLYFSVRDGAAATARAAGAGGGSALALATAAAARRAYAAAGAAAAAAAAPAAAAGAHMGGPSAAFRHPPALGGGLLGFPAAAGPGAPLLRGGAERRPDLPAPGGFAGAIPWANPTMPANHFTATRLYKFIPHLLNTQNRDTFALTLTGGHLSFTEKDEKRKLTLPQYMEATTIAGERENAHCLEDHAAFVLRIVRLWEIWNPSHLQDFDAAVRDKLLRYPGTTYSSDHSLEFQRHVQSRQFEHHRTDYKATPGGTHTRPPPPHRQVQRGTHAASGARPVSGPPGAGGAAGPARGPPASKAAADLYCRQYMSEKGCPHATHASGTGCRRIHWCIGCRRTGGAHDTHCPNCPVTDRTKEYMNSIRTLS